MDLKEAQPNARVRHYEYGDGTVDSASGGFLSIVWDRAMPDSATHRLDHFLSFVEQLELLEPAPATSP